MVRNTLRYVADKDKKEFANDLKQIYHASNEEAGHAIMLEVAKKWSDAYPNAMKRWSEHWDVVSPMFKFSEDVRKVIYTTYTDKKTMPTFFSESLICTGIHKIIGIVFLSVFVVLSRYRDSTTNIIEGLNRQFRQITKNKPSFQNDDSLRKMLYLASKKIVERWTQRCRNWDVILSQLEMLSDRRSA